MSTCVSDGSRKFDNAVENEGSFDFMETGIPSAGRSCDTKKEDVSRQRQSYTCSSSLESFGDRGDLGDDLETAFTSCLMKN